MIKFYLKPVLYLIIIAGIWACKKDNNNDNNNDGVPLIFSELKAENDTIYSGTSTTITATASGSNLSYLWSATAGDILGSGTTVNYAAPPCVPGINEISCTVKDGNNNSDTKSINIVVL